MKLYSMPGAYENDNSVDLMETWKEVEQVRKGLNFSNSLRGFRPRSFQIICVFLSDLPKRTGQGYWAL